MRAPWTRHVLPFIVLGGIVVTALSSKRNYAALMAEDGWAEWATFLAFLISGVLAIRALLEKPKRSALERLAFVGIALFCFFVAGEEISWGQRLISFQPPKIFLEKNYQQESNLHNLLKNILDTRWMVLGVCAVYGLLLPVLTRLRPFARFKALAPHPTLIPWFVVVGMLELFYPFKLVGELAELMLGQAFLLDVLERRGQTSEGARVLIFQLATIAGPLILIPAIDRVVYGDAAKDSPVAQRELELLRNDLLQPGVVREKLLRKRHVHKRIFTAVRSKYLKFGKSSALLENKSTPAEKGSADTKRYDRIGYFLDPWNQPYWLWYEPSRSASAPRLIIYSFGPDRRRYIDPDHWRTDSPSSDDVVVEVILTSTATTS